MKLKSITLQGFKSFPEKTQIHFHEGTTAIVGPNGSGKSNITDAIRWVLGEQSVKTLRTKKMEELIFSGTSTRRPLSYAEVTLHMDNSDLSLAVDFKEVRVSRRIYRSGESEYLINDSKCRLKDITELFLDTGIGRDGYSMIGQGRVDDILSGKAELRRKMLDEAAGITKYKLRKEESEKKLAHTEQNLIRLNDILSEIEKQKTPLERQAKKARKFLTLQEELKSDDLALLYFDIDRKELDCKKHKEDLEHFSSNVEDAEKQKEDILQASANYREEMQVASTTLETLEKEENDVSNEFHHFHQEKALALQKLEQINQRNDRYLTQEAELQDRLESIASELENKSKEQDSLHSQFETAKRKLELEQQELDLLREKKSSTLANEESLRKKIEEARQNLENVLQNSRTEATNVEVLRAHLRMLEADANQLAADLDQENTQSTDLHKRLEEVKAESLRLQKQNAQLEQSSEEKRRLLSETGQKEQDLQTKLLNLQYQRKTQEELQESFEGYSFPVKKLMEHVLKQESEVYGPLADLLQVPEKYEAAIESVLGATAQNIVVETEDTGRRMIELLREKRWGRATFLPLNRLQVKPIASNDIDAIQHMPGYIGIASDLVDFPSSIQTAVEYSLGRTVVAENLDRALELAKKTSFRIRIASLEGDLLNPGGTMSGGSRKQNQSGLLSRKRLLDEIEKNIEENELALQKLYESKSSLEEEMKQATEKLGQTSLRLVELSREEVLLGSHIKQFEQNTMRLTSKHEQNLADMDRIQSDLSQSEKSIAEANVKVEKCKEVITHLENELLTIRSSKQTDDSVIDEKAAICSTLQVELTQWKERKNSIDQLITRLKAELKQTKDETQVQKSDAENDEKEKASIQNWLANSKVREESQKEHLADIQDKIREAKERRDLASVNLESNSQSLETISDYVSKLGLEQGRLEQRLENAENQLMDLRSRLWEEYACTFADKEKWFIVDLDSAKTREKVKKLRMEIKELGNVNIQAIEESKEITERFQFMDKQRNDILEAQEDLKAIIANITDGMQKQFKESFQFINAEFHEIFSKLFGGGQAELVLENTGDVLNSTIDIRVSPPGKRLQNMLALSGGERCLTAIALLFAIQKLNPSPFCVLDEVEAALDEANVFRFTDYINENAEKTQYILVTHRRGTMEAAKMIYGVTMQERGVSNIISVKLDS